MLVVDRLGASQLPVFGSTMIDTPNLNQLASESLVFDFAISDSPELARSLRSLWFPTHAAAKVTPENHLADDLGSLGCGSILLTDDPHVANHEFAGSFDRTIELEAPSQAQAANEIGDSWLASFFAQVVEAVTTLPSGTLLWVHCQGLNRAWDAPYEYRLQIADEEDPAPPTLITPPKGTFDPKSDSPDLLLGYQQACLAQVKMLDRFLGVFHDVVKNNSEPTLFSLLSTRGYPLGEHGDVGDEANLYNESLHVPLMVRWPDGKHRAVRNPNLVQPNILLPIIKQWFGSNESHDPFPNSVFPNANNIAVSVCQNMEAIQTVDWKLIRQSDDEIFQLFNKPDDRWEVSDVHDRCAHEIPALEELLRQSLADLNSKKSKLLSLGFSSANLGDG